MNIGKAYYNLLWYVGSPDKDGDKATDADRDKWTYWFRRQQKRIGTKWYLLPFTTITGLHILTWAEQGWRKLLPAAGLLFAYWLLAHIVDSKDDTFTKKVLRDKRRAYVAKRNRGAAGATPFKT